MKSAIANQNKQTNPNTNGNSLSGVAITIACLSFFPLVYLIGKTMMSLL
jgi:hypothetical protein